MADKSKKDKFGEKLAKHKPPAKDLEEKTPQDKQLRHRRTKAELDAGKYDGVFVTEPDILLIPLVKIIYNIVPNAFVQQIPQKDQDLIDMARRGLLISDDETRNIALPLTQIKNYYFKSVNPIVFAILNLASGIVATIPARTELIKTLKFELARRYPRPEKKADVKAEEKPKEEVKPLVDLCTCNLPQNIPIKDGICTVCKKRRTAKK